MVLVRLGVVEFGPNYLVTAQHLMAKATVRKTEVAAENRTHTMRIFVFGTGRVGASFVQYARHLRHDVAGAGRRACDENPAAARRAVAGADIVAAAIPDDLLSAWFDEWRSVIGEKTVIHFSGAAEIVGMLGYHPLYSFPKEPLAPETMRQIAIARAVGAPPFSAILPGATNPELEVAVADRAFYHALAVLSGNFAAHLWNETALAFGSRFSTPPGDVMAFYLAGVVERFRENPLNSMTGPVARRDAGSVAANLAALDGHPRLKALYLDFLKSAWPTYPAGRENP